MSNRRQDMPSIAAWLDDLRSVFGQAEIDGQIRKGLNGEQTFWATENGYKLGTRNTMHTSAIQWDQQGISRSGTPVWVLEARKLAQRLGVEIAPADPNVVGDEIREANELRSMIAAAKQSKR